MNQTYTLLVNIAHFQFEKCKIITTDGVMFVCGKMAKVVKMLFMLVFLVTCTQQLSASVFKGDASLNANGTISMTDGQNNSKGGVFSGTQLNLNTGFDITLQVRISATNGAEGMCFVLLNRNTVNLGTSGGGLGYGGIDTSLGVEFDMHDNGSGYNDNNSDHVAVRRNGLFTSAGNLSGSVSAANLEDNSYHDLRIRYIPATTRLEVWVDGTREINLNYNIKNNIFFGDPTVYWGFTATTESSGGNVRITLRDLSTPLPVILTSFKGEAVNDNNVLSWTTASEYNAERFDILRSADGNIWEQVGSVPAAGFSYSEVNYSFTDYAPGAQKLYYKIRQVDFDGKEEYFKVISVERQTVVENNNNHNFYDMSGNHVFFGKVEDFIKMCEPGKIYVSDENKKYMKSNN